MDWIEPIIDRTNADVQYAQQNRIGPPTLKGSMNFTDWARITGNVHYLAATLTMLGYPVSVYCQTSWTRSDKPTRAAVQAIYEDIERIQQTYYRIAHCPILSWNTYEKINEVERILFEAKNVIDRMIATFRHSGTFYSGQGGLFV